MRTRDRDIAEQYPRSAGGSVEAIIVDLSTQRGIVEMGIGMFCIKLEDWGSGQREKTFGG